MSHGLWHIQNPNCIETGKGKRKGISSQNSLIEMNKRSDNWLFMTDQLLKPSVFIILHSSQNAQRCVIVVVQYISE